MTTRKHRIAIFASGEGTNFEAIVTATERGELTAEVVLLVCDKPQAAVVARAARHGIDCFAFDPKQYAAKEAYESAIVERLDRKGVELVCLAGYMRLVGKMLLEHYAGRIINIHPSLLPAFRGARAIEQAMEAGVKVFGVTIHEVDASLDGGRILAQKAIEYEGTNQAELEQLIHAVEHPLYIKTVEKLLNELE